MADRSEKLAIVIEIVDQGSGKVTKLKGEITGLGAAARGSSLGLGQAHRGILGVGGATGVASRGVAGLTGAFRHAKGAVGELLSGPLGILGLGGGILAMGGIIEGSLQKTSEFGLSLEKLTALTGESAQSMGELTIVASKYGIASDQLANIVGFTEKTLGKLDPVTGDNAASMGKLHKAQEGVTNASEKLHIAELKLKETEGKRHVTASQLATAEDRVRTAEQALADARNKLNAETAGAGAATSKLTDLEKQYGVRLTDNKGKALSFSQVLNNVADYYQTNASASDKAALSAKIFGRGYAALIPILDLGSAGINRAKQAVADMGLSLGTDSQGAINAYKAALRQLEDAVNVLQIQIGLALAPTITDLANTISGFLEHGGAKQIVGFFKEGASFAKGLGHAVETDVLPVFGAIAGAWNAVPPEVRDLLIKGFVGDRVLKVAFGFSPISFAKDALGKGIGSIFGKAVGGIFARGATPANPMFVADVSGGLGAGKGLLGGAGSIITKAAGAGLAFVGSQGITAGTSMGGPAGAGVGALGGAGLIAGGALIAGPLGAIAGSVAAVGQTLIDIRQNSASQGDGIAASIANQIAGGAKLGDLKTSLSAVDQGINDIQANPLNVLLAGDALDQLKAQHDALTQQIALVEAGNQEQGFANANAREDRGIISSAAAATKAQTPILDSIHRDFVNGLRSLAHELDPAKVIAETNKIVHAVEKGVGSSEHTKDAIRQLKAKLNDVHDPKAQAVLHAAIAKLEAKVPGREYVEREIREARKIAASTESTKQKVHDLKIIEHNLLTSGNKHAASQVGQLIAIAANTLATALNIGSFTVTSQHHTGPSRTRPHPSSTPTPSKPSSPSTASNPYTQYAEGSWSVPRTGAAIVHAGEMIIPSREAARARAGMMAPSLARAIMVQLQVQVNVQPRLSFGLSNFARKSAAEARYGKVSAG